MRYKIGQGGSSTTQTSLRACLSEWCCLSCWSAALPHAMTDHMVHLAEAEPQQCINHGGPL